MRKMSVIRFRKKLIGIYILDFFDVGDSAAGLFSSWTNEQASLIFKEQEEKADPLNFLLRNF